jgi:hypothetical protein
MPGLFLGRVTAPARRELRPSVESRATGDFNAARNQAIGGGICSASGREALHDLIFLGTLAPRRRTALQPPAKGTLGLTPPSPPAIPGRPGLAPDPRTSETNSISPAVIVVCFKNIGCNVIAAACLRVGRFIRAGFRKGTEHDASERIGLLKETKMSQSNRDDATAETGAQVRARPHDSGSAANETVDGLDTTTEALRHAAEDTPSGTGPGDIEKVPVFDRADLAPKI